MRVISQPDLAPGTLLYWCTQEDADDGYCLLLLQPTVGYEGEPSWNCMMISHSKIVCVEISAKDLLYYKYFLALTRQKVRT